MANECAELTDIFLKLTRENEALKAELAHAQRYKVDAERYRWLNDNGCIFWTGVNTDNEVKHQVCEWAMNDVIDQAMKENLTKGVTK